MTTEFYRYTVKMSKPQKIKLKKYQIHKEKLQFRLCEQCGQTFSRRSTLIRHQHTVHTEHPCEAMMSCWTCGLMYRSDNYQRHLQTPKHINKAAQYMDNSREKSKDDYYTYMHEFEPSTSEMPPPKYRPSCKVKDLRTDPAIIPIEATIPQEDPRTAKQISFMDLLTDESQPPTIPTTHEKAPINTVNTAPPEEMLIQTEDILNIITDLEEMGIPVTLENSDEPKPTKEQLIEKPTECNAAEEDLPPDLQTIDFQDLMKTMDMNHLNLLEDSLLEEIINIDELLNPDWHTLDSTGVTDSINNLEPPTV
jgi:uncharacterized C2H2 Zn-finger protein